MSTHTHTYTPRYTHIVQLEIGLQLTLTKGKGEKKQNFPLLPPSYRHNIIMLQLPRRRDRCSNCLLSRRRRVEKGERRKEDREEKLELGKDNMMWNVATCGRK